MWGDALTRTEVEFCEKVREQLATATWAQPLLRRIPTRAGLDYGSKPGLFELRFAGEIDRLGLTADYEFAAGVGSSTVDFRIACHGFEWLIELVSILTSDAVTRATEHHGSFSSTRLSSDSVDRTQSEEGEILLVQQKIGEKVFSSNQPIKFPQPSPRRYHLIVADVRGFGLGGGDLWDYREIAYGPAGVTCEHREFLRHYWRTPDGKILPILGLFDPANTKQRFTRVLQERVHFLGFCNDEEYALGSILRHTHYLANPSMFPNDTVANDAHRQYPLRFQDVSASGSDKGSLVVA
jgi:hypothetical protein